MKELCEELNYNYFLCNWTIGCSIKGYIIHHSIWMYYSGQQIRMKEY